MAKGDSTSKNKQPRKKLNVSQIAFLVVSVIVILSFILSLVAK